MRKRELYSEFQSLIKSTCHPLHSHKMNVHQISASFHYLRHIDNHKSSQIHKMKISKLHLVVSNIIHFTLHPLLHPSNRFRQRNYMKWINVSLLVCFKLSSKLKALILFHVFSFLVSAIALLAHWWIFFRMKLYCLRCAAVAEPK